MLEFDQTEPFMNILFQPLTMTEPLAQIMATWYNDPEIAPFIHPTFTQSEPQKFTAQLLMDQDAPSSIQRIVILDDLKPIGELSITRDFHWLMGSHESTAWISICIGEKSYWGIGIAKLAMAYLEEECRRLGFKRIELGVFENNLKAQALYQKMGYVPFARTEHMTYSQGAWRDDIRMEKFL